MGIKAVEVRKEGGDMALGVRGRKSVGLGE